MLAKVMSFAALAALLLVANGIHGGPVSAQTEFDEGHFDVLDIGYEDGELGIVIHDEEADREIEPSNAVFIVKTRAQTVVPNVPQYVFLGTPGSQVWILPQVQDADLLWPGWATAEVPGGTFRNNSVQVRLAGVNGPGRFAIYTVNEFGSPSLVVGSASADPKSFNLSAGIHGHANWAFTASGRYQVTFEASGTLNNGTEVTSGPVRYTFEVQPSGAPAAPLPPPAAAPAAPAAPAPAAPLPAATPTTAPVTTAPVMTPPRTGDGGLAATSGGSSSSLASPIMLVVAGVVGAVVQLVRIGSLQRRQG
jgi:surface-anchored protein